MVVSSSHVTTLHITGAQMNVELINNERGAKKLKAGKTKGGVSD